MSTVRKIKGSPTEDSYAGCGVAHESGIGPTAADALRSLQTSYQRQADLVSLMLRQATHDESPSEGSLARAIQAAS